MSRRKKTINKAQEYKTHREENILEEFQGSTAELYVLKVLHFIKKNLKNVIIAFAGIAIVSSILIVFFVLKENEEQKSLQAFETILESQVASSALSSSILALEDIKKYEKNFDSTNSKKRTALAKIKYLIEDKKFEAAAENCEYLAQNMHYPEMKSWFYIRSAFLYEKAKKTKLALVAYQNVAKTDSPIKMIVVHARYGEIRMLLESGQITNAQNVLKQMLDIKSDRSEIKELQKQAFALVLMKSSKE